MWGMIEVLSQLLTGEAAIVVRVRAYNATGESALGEDDIRRGPIVLLTCDLEGLPEGNVVTSYKWYNTCTTCQCEIQGDSYYTAVNDTLLVDCTSWDGGRRGHTCEVEYRSEESRAVTITGFITYKLTG